MRSFLIPAMAAALLAACAASEGGSGTATAAAPELAQADPTAMPAATDANADADSTGAPADEAAGSPIDSTDGAADTGGGSSIAGDIQLGNQSAPVMRVCAHPVAGGSPTCVDSAAGASEYRVAVAPGRYYLMGWVRDGELKLLAHAEQIRCIRAPCPPDELIVVQVAAGEHKTGIRLAGGYADVPAGWPRAPG